MKSTTVSPQSRNARFPGITHAARDLGCTRVHLYLVISGQRDSKPLISRWKQWLRENPHYGEIQTESF